MLRQRVLTAIVLLLPFMAALFLLPPTGLALLLGLVCVLAAWEWASLAGVKAPAARAVYAGLVLLPCIPAALAALNPDGSALAFVRGLLYLALICWVLCFALICRFSPPDHPKQTPFLPLWLLLGLVLIPAALAGLIRVRLSAPGLSALLVLFLLVWAADIGAYFVGRAFGRHKLAPRVSPGKTWQGFAGGLAASLVVAAIAHVWAPPAVDWLGWMLLCGGVSVISVIGDLTESLLKRLAGAKDSGTLLPGHGGVLDRIDSLLAAAPFMAVGLGLLGLSP